MNLPSVAVTDIKNGLGKSGKNLEKSGKILSNLFKPLPKVTLESRFIREGRAMVSYLSQNWMKERKTRGA